MNKFTKTLFTRSFWSLSTAFFSIALATAFVGENVAVQNESWINSFLNINPYIKVDNKDDNTPDVMYYKPDFCQYRWHYNSETDSYEFQKRWNEEGLYNYLRDVAYRTNTEGSVLLKNENNALPLKEGDKVSIFGTAQSNKNYITTGQGSCAHDANTTDQLDTCLKSNGILINPELLQINSRYAPSYHPSSFTPAGSSDINYLEYKVNEIPYTDIESTVNSSIASYGDSAIYVISRLGSENGDTDFTCPDNINENYMDLNNEEINYIEHLVELKNQGKIKNIVLVLNSCGAMQFRTIQNYPIDAILSVGTGGTISYRALADVLTGKADPNGHLADTYLMDNYSAPSTVNMGDFTYLESKGVPKNERYACNDKYLVYQEGIYVGYKYYETRYEDKVLNQGNADSAMGAVMSSTGWNYQEEVAYPFGYGSSYATFKWSDMKSSNKNGIYNFKVTVENTSDTYSGKDAVQLYIQKPYTQYDKDNLIEKASVELIGFAKTNLLKPGEKQEVEIIVDQDVMKSYDSYNKKTYIAEQGDYYFTLAEDSHQAINNILAAKNVSDSQLDSAGNKDMVYNKSLEQDDFETFSKSVTGYPITNQFDNADLNLYDCTYDQHITYLSRNDWMSTYPEIVQLTCSNPGMIDDMQYGKEIPDEDVEMPTFGADNGLSLIDMLYEDFDSPKWDLLLDQLTLNDAKSLLLLGGNIIGGAPSLNAPGSLVSDAGAGFRNVPTSFAYPGGTTLANTFNLDLIKELGEAFGIEGQYVGYTALYGPGANIHRNGFGGRNFEFYSEDPTLSGLMLNAEISGMSKMGLVTYVKHFAMNNQERNRYGGCIFANEQTIRETYLKSFEYTYSTEETKATGIMTALGRIGCTWVGAHKGVMNEVLRNEWGFKGSAITDAAVGGYMGANNNHKALANALLATQSLWLSDFRAQGFGGYENLPIVAQAIRKACKYNLYSQLNSAAMNGIKSGTKIVEITPWWKDALHTIQISLACITGVTLSMAIASFILVYIDSKRRLENETAE